MENGGNGTRAGVDAHTIKVSAGGVCACIHVCAHARVRVDHGLGSNKTLLKVLVIHVHICKGRSSREGLEYCRDNAERYTDRNTGEGIHRRGCGDHNY